MAASGSLISDLECWMSFWLLQLSDPVCGSGGAPASSLSRFLKPGAACMSSAHGQNSIFIAKEETALLVLDRSKTFGTMQQEPFGSFSGTGLEA